MEFLAIARDFLEIQGKTSLEVTSSTVLTSLLLGTDLKMIPELLSQIKTTGTLYFFVISGLHFIILERVIGALLAPLPFSKNIRSSGTSMCLFLFGGVVGFSIPIVRTLVMHSYKLLGIHMRRRVSKKIVFAWMVLCMVCIAPLQSKPTVLSVSFLLSFGAVFALLFFSKKQQGRSFAQQIQNQLWAGLSVNVLIAPLLLYFFNAWNPMSLFFSLIFSPFVSILVIMGFAFLAWETVSEGLFSSFQPVSTVLVGGFSLVVRSFSIILEYFDRISWNLTTEISLKALLTYYLFLCVALLLWWYVRKQYETDFL